jgi:hypothetical protein
MKFFGHNSVAGQVWVRIGTRWFGQLSKNLRSVVQLFGPIRRPMNCSKNALHIEQ